MLSLIAVLLLLVSAGCGLLGIGSGYRGGVHGMRPLGGDEVVVNPLEKSAAWITAKRSVSLHYQPVPGDLPSLVVFQYRQTGNRKWVLGPGWIPGGDAPRWNPPGDGHKRDRERVRVRDRDRGRS